MQNLEVTYMGLRLKNPIVVSSSGLTARIEKIMELEKAGAGAIVLKSLFEEQIASEAASLHYYTDFPEAADYLVQYTRAHSISKHIELIKEAKEKCSIPIIASINCVTGGEWISFAKEIEKAGADAMELNIFLLPLEKESNSAEIERQYLDTVAAVCKSLSIPVAVKIAPNFTNIPYIAQELYYRGAKGVVMFNRFFEPDIDVNHMKMTASTIFSRPSELRNVLRWMAVTSSRVDQVDYAASTGIHDGEAVVKALLSGATVAEVCSTIYQNGEGVIGEMLEYLKKWMQSHMFVRVKDFVGQMNYKNVTNPLAYERSQFMKYFADQNAPENIRGL